MGEEDKANAMVARMGPLVGSLNGSTIAKLGSFSGLSGDLSADVADGIGSFGEALNLITCGAGSECYKTKQKDILRTIYDGKQKLYNSLPLDLSRAEKNYYMYNETDERYNKLIYDRFAASADEFELNSIEKQQQFMSDLIHSIKQYQSGMIFKNQIDNLLKTRQKEQDNLKKNINYYQTILHTSERKVVYENKNMDSLYLYRRVMIFLYYAALVCFIIFGNFIPDKLYTKWSVWLLIVIVAIIPIIMNMVLMWVFIIYDTVVYWFSELPHKDVYVDFGNPANEKPPPPAPSVGSVSTLPINV